MSRSAWCLTAALLLGLASIIVTRVFRAFTVAEVLAILAFIPGLGLFWLSRVAADDKALPWPHRLVIAGSVIGIVGLLIKAVFVVFGIGTGGHDMTSHSTAPNPLLQHIHHLFFNVGFLFFLIALIVMIVSRFRRGDGLP